MRPSLNTDLDVAMLKKVLWNFVEQRTTEEMSNAAKTIEYHDQRRRIISIGIVVNGLTRLLRISSTISRIRITIPKIHNVSISVIALKRNCSDSMTRESYRLLNALTVH